MHAVLCTRRHVRAARQQRRRKRRTEEEGRRKKGAEGQERGREASLTCARQMAPTAVASTHSTNTRSTEAGMQMRLDARTHEPSGALHTRDRSARLHFTDGCSLV
jgi:hypothetical protein